MTTIADQPRELWNAVLGELQLHVTRPSFETWLRRTEGVAFRDGEFTVGTPNAFVAEMLEQRMYSLISQTVERVVKAPVEVLFRVALSSGDGPSHDSAGPALGPDGKWRRPRLPEATAGRWPEAARPTAVRYWPTTCIYRSRCPTSGIALR